MTRLPRAVLATALWLCACPVHAGNGTWTTSYPFGANVSSSQLAVDPANPGRLYVAPLWRGVYRSDDGGTSWTPLLDEVAAPFDAKHLSGLSVDAGGSVYLVSWDGNAGRQALFRSTDGGSSWAGRDSGVSGDVTVLAWAPGAPAVAYLGTRQGFVFRSANGGASWSLATAGLPADEVRCLEVDPSDAQVVYAGTLASGLYRSADGGASWSSASGGGLLITIGDVAIDPGDPQVLYAADDHPSSKGIYKSTDGGTSWTLLPPQLELSGGAGQLIALDPSDPQRLFAIDAHEVLRSTDGGASWSVVVSGTALLSSVLLDPAAPSTVFAASYDAGLLRSTDGGTSWAPANGGLRGLHLPHSRARSLAFDASDPAVVYSGGIPRGWRSADGGATWADLAHPNPQVFTFASHPAAPGVVYAASNDLWRSTDGGATWASWSGGAFCCFQESDVAVHPADPQTLYLAGRGSGPATDGFYRSTDGGLTWTRSVAGMSDTALRVLAVDPNDGDVVFAATAPGPAAVLYRSTDGGLSWSLLSALPAGLGINQVSVHPLDSNLVFLAAEASPGAGLYRSLDGGASWQQLFSENGNTVAVDPTDAGKVYFGTWNTTGFYRSLDGGATWAVINAGLPVNPGIEAIAVDPANPNRLLLGTSGGVYELTLAGTVPLTVHRLDDAGPGSLRDALAVAEADGLPTAIRFHPSLAGGTVHLQSQLPPWLAGDTDLDADADGDCQPDVALDGSQLAFGNGVTLLSDGNRVRGLAIHSFPSPGNGGVGVQVGFSGQPAGDNVVECNYLGTDLGGTTPRGNAAGIGVAGGASDNRLGPGNRIVFNALAGISIEDDLLAADPLSAALAAGGEPLLARVGSERNRITANAIHDNGGLGIDLVAGGSDPAGVNPNDPGDADVGPNELLNTPVLGSASHLGGGSFEVVGTAPPGATVELFSAVPDPSGSGEGAVLLATFPALPDGTFTATVAVPVDVYQLTATATDAAGNTSEFSPLFSAKLPDAVSLGGTTAFEGEVASVPIYLRDLPATLLGGDQPAGGRIQALSVQVELAPAGSVAAISGGRAGITAGLVPIFELTTVTGNRATYLATFDELASPLPLTTGAAAPGDLVARFEVTLAPSAPPIPVTLTLVAAGTVLANQAGTVEESVAGGNLVLAGNGTITVRTRAATALDAVAESAASVRLSWLDPAAGELGFRLERSPDGLGWAPVATLGPDVTSHVDGALAAATLYYYRVVSFSGAGDNLPSNVAAATTFPAAGARVCSHQLSQGHSWARLPSLAHNGVRWAMAYQERINATNDEVFFQLLDNASGTPVGGPVLLSHSDSASQLPVLRWNGQRFGALWQEQLRGPAGEIDSNVFFALLDAGGQVLRGPVRLFDAPLVGSGLPADLEAPLVWDGGGWGLFFGEFVAAPDAGIRFWRFTEDGELLLGPVQLSSDAADESGVQAGWSGTEYGVAWLRQDGGDSRVLFERRLPDGTAPAGSPGVVEVWQGAPGEVAIDLALTWDGSRWALAWGRISADGQEAAQHLRLLDAAGVPLGPVQRLSDDFDPDLPPGDQVPVDDELPKLFPRPGGGFICFTTSFASVSSSWEIARLLADAGGVRQGSRSILTAADGLGAAWTRAASDGTRFLVGFHELTAGTQEIGDVLVNATGVPLAGPHTLTAGHSPGSNVVGFVEGASGGAVASLQGGFVALWTDRFAGVLRLHGRVFDPAGAPAADLLPLSLRDVRGLPGLVGVGSTFAVAWKDVANNVVFHRFDAAGAPVLGGEAIVASSTTGRAHVALAFSGERYGVLWQEGGNVVLREVDPAGNVLSDRIVAGGNARSQPMELEWTGAGWAVAWVGGDGNLHYALVDRFGQVAVPDVTVTATGEVRNRFDLLWNGQVLALAWTDLDAGQANGELYVKTFDLGGGELLPPVTVLAQVQQHTPRLFWSGDRFHLLRAGVPGGDDGTLEDEILPNGTVLLGVRRWTQRGTPLAAAFDGTTAGLLWPQLGEIFFATGACFDDLTPPSCPALAASYDGQQVHFAWPAGDDPESGLWRYNLYRDGSHLAELFPSSTAFADRGPRAGFVHGYQLRALNGALLESAGCPTLLRSTVPGDVNADGAVNGADVLYLVNFFFGGGEGPRGPADANGDGQVTIADLFYLINFVYGGGPPPAGFTGGHQPPGEGFTGTPDQLALGTTGGKAGATVTVPITVHDTAGTPLSEGAGANHEIQGFGLRVDFVPAEAVAGVSFQQAGATAGRTAVAPIVQTFPDHLVVLINFQEGSHPLALTLDAATVVGQLRVTLSPQAVPGTVVELRLQSATATLVGSDATVSETVALGTLATADGAVQVFGVQLFADGFESGNTTAWSAQVP